MEDDILIRTDGNWSRPVVSSMARLNQIQPSIYNIGLHDAGSLKPPRSLKNTHLKTERDLQSTDGFGVNATHQQAELTEGNGLSSGRQSFRELTATPPVLSTSYQRAAWGSNSSIPELIARQGKASHSKRPSSATLQSKVLRDACRRTRPQSAKELLGKDERKKPVLKITGQRKTVQANGLPPHHPGYVPATHGNPSVHKRQGTAWASLPPGHVSTVNGAKPGNPTYEGDPLPPNAPYSSPVQSDSEYEEEFSGRPSTPPLRYRPQSHPIHLSLPTTDDGADDSELLDTDRLLQEADNFVQRKKEEEETQAADVCTTWPESLHDVDYADSPDAQEINSSERFIKTTIQSKLHEQMLKKQNDREKRDRARKERKNRESADSFLSSDSSSEYSSDGDIDVDVREVGINESDARIPANRVKDTDVPNTSTDDSKKKSNVSGQKEFLLPDGGDTSFLALELSENSQIIRKPLGPKSLDKARAKARAMGVKFREDRNITVDITPRNMGRKVVNTTYRPNAKKSASLPQQDKPSKDHSDCLCNAGLEGLGLTEDEMKAFRKDIEQEFSQSGLSVPQSSQKRSQLVSVVTVDYTDDTAAEDEEKKSNKKKGKKSMQEVETMVSKLSQAEQLDDFGLPVSQILHKSAPEQNYYERSRSGSRMQSRPPSAQPERKKESEEDSTVYMTTKTVEFGPGGPHETVSKTAVSAHHERKTKDPHSHSAPIWPSSIKRQKEKMKLEKEVGRAAENEHEEDGCEKNGSDGVDVEQLEQLLQDAKVMAKESINDVSKKRPPSGKRPSSKLKKRTEETGTKEMQKPVQWTANAKPASSAEMSRSKEAIQALRKDQEDKRYSMYSTKGPRYHSHSKPRAQSAGSVRPPVFLSTLPYEDDEDTEEFQECLDMKTKMAALGVDIDPKVLERALFAPSGKSLHFNVPGELPQDPSDGLLTHYKYWLSEDYKRVQQMNRRLARDDHIRYLQKLAEEKKKKRLAAKGKKGGKKSKKNQNRCETPSKNAM